MDSHRHWHYTGDSLKLRKYEGHQFLVNTLLHTMLKLLMDHSYGKCIITHYITTLVSSIVCVKSDFNVVIKSFDSSERKRDTVS